MEKRLVFVSVYASFNKTFEQLCCENNYPYVIVDAKLDEAVTALKKRFPGEFPAVIISRGVTAEIIQDAFRNTVVITADPDDSDFIDSLKEAKKFGKHMGCLMNKRIVPYNMLDRLREILAIDEIELFTYENSGDIEQAFITAKTRGLDVMVGGGQLGSALGIKYELPTVFIASGQRTIWKAVTKAWTVLEYLHREHEQDIMFNTVVTAIEDGILAVRDGTLTMMNPAAEKILNLYFEQTVGSKIADIHKDLYQFIMQAGNSGKTININSKHVLAEKILERDDDGQREQIVILHDIGHLQRMEQRVRSDLYSKGLVARYTLKDIVGKNSKMQRTIDEARIFARTDANILISGESGTGKELLAQGIHNASRRRNAPFVAINCVELPESLLESELFGYAEGAFTGAKKGGKIGLLELAHGGTVFLDEINSTTFSLQGKLLRAIQEKQVRRIGSDSIIPVDIRVISAVNVDMNKEIQEGRFRRDLYYRLSTLTLHAIPLRERLEDIIELANYFYKQHSVECNCEPLVFTKSMCNLLQGAYWAGNVRELDNVIHRLCVLSAMTEDKEALLEYCMQDIKQSRKDNEDKQGTERTITIRQDTLNQMEEELIRHVLEAAEGNRSQTAKQLGISRATLLRKLRINNEADEL